MRAIRHTQPLRSREPQPFTIVNPSAPNEDTLPRRSWSKLKKLAVGTSFTAAVVTLFIIFVEFICRWKDFDWCSGFISTNTTS